MAVFTPQPTHQLQQELVKKFGLVDGVLNTKRKFKGVTFCGPMAVGKTTYAKIFAPGSTKKKVISLAAELKRICINGYGMSPDPEKKDRSLLQAVGDAMRSINPDVFVNFLLHEANADPNFFIICDDGRRLNEFKKMKDEGFLLVYLQVDEKIRLQRAKDLYPHLIEQQMAHETETESKTEEAFKYYDLVIQNNNVDDLHIGRAVVLRKLFGFD